MARMVRFPLSKLRVSCGILTLEEGAKELKISRVHLANLERGRAGASPDLITRMAGLYRVPEKEIERLIGLAQRALYRRQLAAHRPLKRLA